ncbi:GNAT family N-acetyltransferase [Egicoccus sp. AB-alg6-2]|uniref:GNAT family N-acetyltransferase n=1 Tax=Egicoccus sp. AB-alg6-2 TaxID=3242692 RepID=UPI00359E0A8A
MRAPVTEVSTPPPALQRERSIATLVVAFADDPVIRWFLPDAPSYLRRFPELLDLFAETALQAGDVDVAGQDAGAALWHAPDAQLDDKRLVGLMYATVAPERRPAAFGMLEQMAEHHPTEPHWYLPFIGVDPTCQGQGHGSRLLEQGLARSDRDRLPAYLEASSPRNRALYERHGFVAFAELQVADSPPLWPMLRLPA